jgi:hypothetical protein
VLCNILRITQGTRQRFSTMPPMLRRIAMSQSPTRLGAAQRAKTTEHFFWRHRKLIYTDTDRIHEPH